MGSLQGENIANYNLWYIHSYIQRISRVRLGKLFRDFTYIFLKMFSFYFVASYR